jgi:raffinose/stachyose/melibiose transport system permease protein
MLKINANKSLNPRIIVTRIMQYAILITVVTVLFIPIYQTVVSGLKNNGEARSCSYCLPDPIRWENYVTVLFGSAKPGFWTMLLNSMIVLVFTTIAVVLVCSLAAFIFSRTAFRGRDVLFNILMIGLLFPINAAILPIFLTIRSLNLLDTLAGIILPQIAFGMAGTIIILRGFFRAIPSELQDAASIDGCNTFDFFWRVMLPLTRPALAAVAALTAIGSWNSFFLPLLVLSKDTLYTLPLGTMQFQGQYGSDVALTQAFIFLSLIPTVIFYLLAERQIVSGLTSGALKG